MNAVTIIHDETGRAVNCTATTPLGLPAGTPDLIIGKFPWEVNVAYADMLKTRFARCLTFGESFSWTHQSFDGSAIIGVTVRPLVGGGAVSTLRRLPDVTSLSEREVDVCWLLSRGHSVREICKRLDLSQSTVYSHAKSAVRKLGIDGLTGLCAFAAQNCQAFCPLIRTAGDCGGCGQDAEGFDA